MKKPLTVVVWLWTDKGKPSVNNWQHSRYDYRHVNAVYRMVQRYYKTPHRFVCITDNPRGIECETIPLWTDNLHMNGIIPGTWVRVKSWAPEMRELLGPRIVSLDLDCCVVGDLAPLFDRTEPFIGWLAFGERRDPVVYNASIWAADMGAFPELWTSFDPAIAVKELASHGFDHTAGTEQAWASYKLGPDMPVWTWKDGVVSFRYQLRKRRGFPLTPDARIVFFHGPVKPLALRATVPWVRANYPEFK